MRPLVILARHAEDSGKPESRRIDETHRLGYTVEGDALAIVACRYHYD